MFVAGDIIQKILGTFFLGHPVPLSNFYFLYTSFFISNKTKNVQLVDFLKSLIFVILKTSTPENGEESDQKSIGEAIKKKKGKLVTSAKKEGGESGRKCDLRFL